LKKKKTFKKKTLFFWFFFNQKPFFKYKLKHFFKKFLIFFNFHKTLILKKKKKKTKNNFIKKKLFQHFFWDIESRINIFLVRVGFLKNLNQSNFCIKKKFIFINNKNNLCFNFKVKKNDLIQISYFLNFFLNIFSKKNIFINFFLIQRLVKKKKNLFFLEINKNIQSCLILYKPKPKNLDFKRINKFNFFFYKYLFYFLKKKKF
jgi:hypothetical protein